MERPLISVIIPVYNVAPYLERCLDSVAAQTWENLEVWLVDDGSTDGSLALCEARAEQDSRFRVLRQANAGVSAARNRGMDHAAGQYLQFVDGDDFLPPDATENQARTAAATIVPARAAKLDDCGSLAPGKRADITVLDDQLNVKAVFIAGRQYIM